MKRKRNAGHMKHQSSFLWGPVLPTLLQDVHLAAALWLPPANRVPSRRKLDARRVVTPAPNAKSVVLPPVVFARAEARPLVNVKAAVCLHKACPPVQGNRSPMNSLIVNPDQGFIAKHYGWSVSASEI